MIVKLGYALSIKTKYIQKRGNVYQFAMRVPSELVEHYGKKHIRQSLGTEDPKVAAHKAERLAQTYNAEFAALRGGSKLTPRQTLDAAARMAERYVTLDSFVDQVAEPKRQAHAGQCWETYEHAPVEEFLTPVEQEVLKRLQKPDILRLSGVITYYEKHHKKAGDQRFMERVRTDWNKLIEVVGDIPFNDLSRTHARAYIDHRLAEGKATGTVRRGLRQLRAITELCIRETETKRTNPFAALEIPNEGKDAKKRKVPTDSELREIVKTFLNDPSPTAQIILLQLETGTRIAEVTGLKLRDVVLDHEVPHIDLRENEWRSLKTENTAERLVPLVGVALHAARQAVEAHSGESEGLFPKYAKPRGNDTASAAVNKRLKRWSITSHCLRHAMKDRLKEADITKDMRGAIQGHGASDMDDHYGKGVALWKKQKALGKVAIDIENLEANPKGY